MKLLLLLGAADGVRSAADARQCLAAQCAAMDCGWDICLYGPGDLAQFAVDSGLGGKVYLLPAQTAIPSVIAQGLGDLVHTAGYQGILAADGARSRDLAAWIGAAWGFSALTGVCHMERSGDSFQCSRPLYNQNLLGHYQIRPPFIISEKLPRAKTADGGCAPLQCMRLPPCVDPPFLLAQTVEPRQSRGKRSPVLLVAGMGVGERADVERIRAFAAENGFDFGVTRPVAMRGWGGMEEIVGVSGTIFAPQITVTLGVSGAAAFFVGIEQSRYILAVNTSPTVNIASLCDALIVDDYRAVLDRLLTRLKPYRQEGACRPNVP